MSFFFHLVTLLFGLPSPKMGHWDELCLLCGISPIPPNGIYTDTAYGAGDLAEKLIEYDPSLLHDMELDEDALQELLQTALDAESSDGFDWFTRPGWRWQGFRTCIAVGHFLSEEDDTPHQIVSTDTGYMRRIPDGQEVETRLVKDANCGEFRVVIHRTVDGEGNVVETQEEKLSRTSSSNYLYDELAREDGFGNFFLSEGCYHYLRAWLDFNQLPEPQRGRQLNLAGELYEVVNSRPKGRVNGIGILPFIDYDGIERTLDQTQYDVAENLNVPKCTTASIRRRDPPEELLDSITRDCRSWMFHAPDMWPVADDEQIIKYAFTQFPMTTIPSDTLKPFPSSVLFNIAQFSDSVVTYFTLARSSKRLYNTLTDSSFLNNALKSMASRPSGCLFWVRPVTTMHGEEKKAYDAISTFLLRTEAAEQDSDSSPLSLFDHKDFPWYYFVRRCFESDSMINRKRIWGQVKQLEGIWRDYRIHGWEVDRFGVPLR
ncbi:hypothetical protein CPB84DRAFT_1753386 [Gymnopilus junonius]|uniref:F-box domain-containing protein n=1 Tax=Gymnopilus junonius TaxID=109634 RepID=A0A9P5N7R8_GYMJU|nr:hypothetical protein CPB84DRAFT_1753386 [Gymnopilus junonius]